ncbi:MAG: bifunctional diaminohydroxyphosphoribosylaminopyrimidine deaminase/5-amino-6-(5-phosphoribosylamino)uracil reductase RibD [Candidatus Bipolaricaulota bacterium]
MSEALMRRALELAALGEGRTRPNPLVGAVVARGEGIVGQAYHKHPGGPHAEVLALEEAGEAACGADLYVNLEPCAHYGRTPPCTARIEAAGIRRVFVATVDPNPLVNGRGIAALQAAGVSVQVGMLAEEAQRLNDIFFHWITAGTPFVTLKLAMSMDGKIATASGASRWITGSPARHLVQRMRRRNAAVLIGVNTVLADDPRLDLREVEGPQPLRVVLDTEARTPVSARLLHLPGQAIVVVGESAPVERVSALEEAGVQVWRLPSTGGRVELVALLGELAREGVDSVLLEGGGEVAWSFLAEELVNKVTLFYGPLILGGRTAVPGVGGEGVDDPSRGFRLCDLSVQRVGEDIMVTGYMGGARDE